MKKAKLVIVSKGIDFKMTAEHMQAAQEHGVDIIKISMNSLPLTTLYNRELEAERQALSHEYLLFVHADVDFDIVHLLSRCDECKAKYDVMGLCGTEYVNVSESPLNWYTSSIRHPEKRWGKVSHGEIGNQIAFFNADRVDNSDHEAGCIDGLCIIFGEKALKSDMKFDEKFIFDQYDTDISFQAILRYNLKLGVIVEQSLYHYSVGKSITTDKFLVGEIKLRDKWNLGYPPKTKIAAMKEYAMKTAQALTNQILKSISSAAVQ